VVNIQSMLNRFRLIIFPDCYAFTAQIADTLSFRGIVNDVIGRTAVGADPATSHTGLDHLIVNLQRNNMVDSDALGIDGLCLRQGAGHPIG